MELAIFTKVPHLLVDATVLQRIPGQLLFDGSSTGLVLGVENHALFVRSTT
jgi:hypothetical protein